MSYETESRPGAGNLERAVQNCVSVGWRVEALTNNGAVLVKGHRVNHVLHAILSVFTCGLWLLVWAIVAATTQESRMTMTIDAAGNVVYGHQVRS